MNTNKAIAVQIPVDAGQLSTAVAPAAATPQGESELKEAVASVRRTSVAIIVTQCVALAWNGFWFYYSQVPLTILALIMSCTVLGAFRKRVFKMAVVVYSVFAVASVARVFDWYLFLKHVDADSSYYSQDEGSVSASTLFASAWPNVLGAVVFLFGALEAFKAVQKWEKTDSVPPEKVVSDV